MYIFNDKEHLRAKRKERARRRRTCRPWLRAPARIYNVVKEHFRRFRRRILYIRHVPESEYDRQWALYGSNNTMSKLLLCPITVVIFVYSLAFYLFTYLGMGIVPLPFFFSVWAFLVELVINVSSFIFESLQNVLTFGVFETTVISPVVLMASFYKCVQTSSLEDLAEMIDGVYIQWMDR
ncbi:hypothetical protein Bpfe_010253 [Biomphalaria pfeifferi]|uniref:Uncharacterized protein n=1 Tax=Biomphalaria pfeifferi TaxID=112525 RepID=A0AAD8BTA8_BIOPF|nr:hypothetical protein Bpfe_010253 [Biomphalaria pfeifferi]